LNRRLFARIAIFLSMGKKSSTIDLRQGIYPEKVYSAGILLRNNVEGDIKSI
jgi:hypothetical protein